MVFVELIKRLINSNSKILLLENLLGKPASFSVSELGRMAGIPKATVSLIINDWEKAGLVESEQQGRNKLVKINQKFYLLPELKRIFSKAGDFQRPLIKSLESSKLIKNQKVAAVIVFGSRTRKDFLHKSDFDVLIILEQKNSVLEEKILEEFVNAAHKTGIRFSPVILDKKEIKSRLKGKDLFILNVLNEGKIIKGRTWIERIQTAF